jgi:Ca2+-binding EF-hand superfamily protein
VDVASGETRPLRRRPCSDARTPARASEPLNAESKPAADARPWTRVAAGGDWAEFDASWRLYLSEGELASFEKNLAVTVSLRRKLEVILAELRGANNLDFFTFTKAAGARGGVRRGRVSGDVRLDGSLTVRQLLVLIRRHRPLTDEEEERLVEAVDPRSRGHVSFATFTAQGMDMLKRLRDDEFEAAWRIVSRRRADGVHRFQGKIRDYVEPDDPRSQGAGVEVSEAGAQGHEGTLDALRAQMRKKGLGPADVFHAMDEDVNDKVKYMQFRRGLEYVGIYTGTRRLFQALDADGNGTLSYAEIEAALTGGVGPTDPDDEDVAAKTRAERRREEQREAMARVARRTSDRDETRRMLRKLRTAVWRIGVGHVRDAPYRGDQPNELGSELETGFALLRRRLRRRALRDGEGELTTLVSVRSFKAVMKAVGMTAAEVDRATAPFQRFVGFDASVTGGRCIGVDYEDVFRMLSRVHGKRGGHADVLFDIEEKYH